MKNIGKKTAWLLMGALTLATSGVAITKVSANMTEVKMPKVGVTIATSNNTPFPTNTPTLVPKAVAVINTSTQPIGKCIITLFNLQYDVTSLQNSHTGGNLFNCGADMTTVYQSQHGTDVTRMQQYLVTTTTPTPTNMSSPTVIPTNGAQPTSSPTISPRSTEELEEHYDFENDNKERDDKENEDRYIKTEIKESEERHSEKDGD